MNRQDVPAAATSVTRIDPIVRRIVQHAACGAPASLAERLEEEWLAHLQSRSGRMTQILFALGCCWATRVIAFEHAEEKVAAASTPTGQKVMTAYAQHDASFFSRRTMILFTIIGLHVLLVYALQTGLTRHDLEVVPDDILVEFKETKVDPTPPPPPPRDPEFQPPQVAVEPPLIAIEDLPPATSSIQTAMIEKVVPARQEPQQRVVQRVVGGPTKGFPSADEYYPATSRRLGEQGISTVRVCVDERGRLTGEPALAQSSGFPRLDESALKVAKAGARHYRPTLEDGRPVSDCYPFRIKYELR